MIKRGPASGSAVSAGSDGGFVGRAGGEAFRDVVREGGFVAVSASVVSDGCSVFAVSFGVTVGRDAGVVARRPTGLLPRAVRVGATTFGASSLGATAGVSTGTGGGESAGVDSGDGSGNGTDASSAGGEGSLIRAPTDETRLPPLDVDGATGNGVSFAATSSPPKMG